MPYNALFLLKAFEIAQGTANNGEDGESGADMYPRAAGKSAKVNRWGREILLPIQETEQSVILGGAFNFKFLDLIQWFGLLIVNFIFLTVVLRFKTSFDYIVRFCTNKLSYWFILNAKIKPNCVRLTR